MPENTPAPDSTEPQVDTPQVVTVAADGPPSALSQAVAEPADAPPPAPPQVVTVAADAPPPAPPVAHRPRYTVHFAVEGVLLLLAIGCLTWTYLGGSRFLGDPSFDHVWRLLGTLAPLLVLAMALALSIRIGAVNLSIMFTALATYMMASQGDFVLALVLALGGGLPLAAVLVFTRIPAWLASLSLGMVALGVSWSWWPEEISGFGSDLGIDPGWFSVLFLLAAVVSIAGGVVASRAGVRRRIDQAVAVVSSERGYSHGSALTVLAVVCASSLLAGLAGILIAEQRFGVGLYTGGTNFSVLTYLSGLVMFLGIVMLGGTAVRGGRGGFAGTVLATVVVFGAWPVWNRFVVSPEPLGMWSESWYPMVVLGAGLLVNCLVDVFGGTRKTVSAPPPA